MTGAIERRSPEEGKFEFRMAELNGNDETRAAVPFDDPWAPTNLREKVRQRYKQTYGEREYVEAAFDHRRSRSARIRDATHYLTYHEKAKRNGEIKPAKRRISHIIITNIDSKKNWNTVNVSTVTVRSCTQLTIPFTGWWFT